VSYSAEVLKENSERHVFAVIKPRIRITEWTLHTGSVYKNSTAFSNLNVVGVAFNGAALAAGASPSLSAAQWYFDFNTKTLYVRKADSSAPSAADWGVVTFEIFLSTWDGFWYRDPSNSATQVVYWRALIKETPSITRSALNVLFGYIPLQSTSIGVVNDKEYFQDWIYDASTCDCECIVWHQAGPLSAVNVHKIFTGICGDIDFGDQEINIGIFDKIHKFQLPVSNYPYSDRYSGLAMEERNNTFIRSIYGRSIYMERYLHGVLVGIYNDTSPGTSDNRNWAFYSKVAGRGDFDATVATTHTTTDLTLLNQEDSNQLIPGDEVETRTGTFVSLVSGINYSTKRLFFSTAPHQTAFPNIHVVGARDVKLIQNGIVYNLKYYRDYTDVSIDSNTYGIALTTSAESNVGASTINPKNGDTIVAKIRGAKISPTYSAAPLFTGKDSFANPIVILYHFLKDRMGYAESEIEVASFISLAATETSRIYFSCPETLGEEPEKYADVLTKIMASCFIHLFVTDLGQFKIRRVGQLASPATVSLTDDDIANPKYSFAYSDVGDVKLILHRLDIALTVSKTAVLSGGAGALVNSQASLAPTLEASYNANTYLHKRANKIDVGTYFEVYRDLSAATYAAEAPATNYNAKISQLIGERRHLLACEIKIGGHDLELGDTVELVRELQPGFTFIEGTTYSRSYVVVEIRKDINGVSVILDDQKSVTGNPSDWS
jgi:hypothetical protein